MPAYVYPEPDELAAYREANSQKDVWEAIGSASSPSTPPPPIEGLATQEEAEAGVVNNKWMSPLRTKQAIDQLGGGDDYESALADPVVSTQVGGAAPEPASVWKTRTLSQALDVILFPTVLPSIGSPKSATLTVSAPTGVQEVGTTVSRTLTFTFNRGLITNGDGSEGPELVGAASSPTYSGPGITGTTGNASLGSVAVIAGPNQWTAGASHEAGSGEYRDNKGNPSTALDDSRAAGSVFASSAAFTGVYPWYHLRSPVSFTPSQFAAAITALGNNTSGTASNISPSATIAKVIASAAGTLSVPFNVSGQFLGVAYEADNTTKTRFYVTDFNSGPITALFNTVETQTDVPQASEFHLVPQASPLWTRDFKMHITTFVQTNTDPIIQLRNP